MAPVPVVKKSRPRESRSTTTTASSAKAARKTGASSHADSAAEWSARDQEDAAAQGWGVFDCIDMDTRKVFLEMEAVGKRFTNDNKAREFVAVQASAGDALALRAVRAVFRSKVGVKARSN